MEYYKPKYLYYQYWKMVPNGFLNESDLNYTFEIIL